MSKFQVFDSVTLNQDIQLHSGGIAPQGTDGAIVFLPDNVVFTNCPKQTLAVRIYLVAYAVKLSWQTILTHIPLVIKA
jgi:hypothetical protein